MPGFEKKFNKALIGLIIGTTIAGVAGAKTVAGKKAINKTKSGAASTFRKVVNFLYSGLEEMKKKMDEGDGKDKLQNNEQ